MNDSCSASYRLEHKKTGEPINWREEPTVKIRIDKKFADMEKGIQDKKDRTFARRKLKQDQLEAKRLRKELKVKPFF